MWKHTGFSSVTVIFPAVDSHKPALSKLNVSSYVVVTVVNQWYHNTLVLHRTEWNCIVYITYQMTNTGLHCQQLLVVVFKKMFEQQERNLNSRKRIRSCGNIVLLKFYRITDDQDYYLALVCCGFYYDIYISTH